MGSAGSSGARGLLVIYFKPAYKAEIERVKDLLVRKDDKFLFLIEQDKDNTGTIRRLRELL